MRLEKSPITIIALFTNILFLRVRNQFTTRHCRVVKIGCIYIFFIWATGLLAL